MRNPPWNRDELILALDLYFRLNPVKASTSHREIKALSRLLNKLPRKDANVDYPLYRNPNGVYKKLCNFLRFDPSYKGKGLTHGGKLEKVIWHEFAGDQITLAQTAKAIRNSYGELKTKDAGFKHVTRDEEFMEGRVLTTIHKRRERNPKVAQKKKAHILNTTGQLACEVCGFDFKEKYGKLGEGFAECHHRVPLARLSAKQATKLDDLAIICANCHRIIHRTRPMISVEKLRDLVQ